MRAYDPRLGRFPSVDPIARQYPWLSPYQFAGDSPIRCSDLDGLEPKSVIEKWMYTRPNHTYEDGMVIKRVEGWWIYEHITSSNSISTFYYYDDSGCDPAWKTFTPLTQEAVDQKRIDATCRSLDNMQKSILGAAMVGTGLAAAGEIFGGQAVADFIVEEVREEALEQATGVPMLNDMKDLAEMGAKRLLKAPAHAFSRTHGLSGNADSRIVQSIMDDMRINGWNGDPIKVLETGGQRYVLDGHHRLEAARRVGIDVQYESIPETSLGAFGYKSVDEVIGAGSEINKVKLDVR